MYQCIWILSQRNPSAFTKAWDLLIVIPPKSIHITTGCISFS